MGSFSRIPSLLRMPVSFLPVKRNVINASSLRAYSQETNQKFAQANAHESQEECDRNNTPNHPIPSNDSQPTLRDGRQSNLSDMEGVRHDNLPEDVRKHNEDMEHRYDRPYNHIAGEGKAENAFEQKLVSLLRFFGA
ncbi:hypothetical protein N7532_008958 [Penicillium argentinense]|uniref:Uncharacterized protein n=1 Tax=Penicillium argentinense TaxID=1131581 RepID=A0A9W9EYD6_9EURO|nr:uncharacterized protein N7532_008958 [Penicillium argentinense]KAJ5090274.1 hypothetical protein N7532_008958 [Penicillium argentinense]